MSRYRDNKSLRRKPRVRKPLFFVEVEGGLTAAVARVLRLLGGRVTEQYRAEYIPGYHTYWDRYTAWRTARSAMRVIAGIAGGGVR